VAHVLMGQTHFLSASNGVKAMKEPILNNEQELCMQLFYWTTVCSSPKSKFYIRFCWQPNTKSTQININSVHIFWWSVERHGNHSCKTTKISICTHL